MYSHKYEDDETFKVEWILLIGILIFPVVILFSLIVRSIDFIALEIRDVQ